MDDLTKVRLTAPGIYASLILEHIETQGHDTSVMTFKCIFQSNLERISIVCDLVVVLGKT